MADPPPYPHIRDDADAGPDGEPITNRPRRRVIAYWIIGIVLVLLFVVLHLTGALGPGAHG